ncbi:HlyD family type I secretion periplasmic adaptor subunit [Pelosinus sp. sgz500959]|uniref:HlyD family type I secretion periplasmic adaptor subunit n=1 Tax=Pelosinus sp. sgz500959 TaxID=3242472 RepID=UPI00366D5DEE
MLKKFLKNKFDDMLTSEETEFMPAAVEVVETPVSPVARMVIYALFIWFSSVLGWAIAGTVDEVATAPGKIIPVGYVKAVQAEDKGIVKHIHVIEGQKVTKGELLVELDSTITQADFERLKKDVAYYTLEIDRLLAEQFDKPFVPNTNLPGLDKKDLEYQLSLYDTRMSEYQMKLEIAQTNVRQAEAGLASALSRKGEYKERLDIASEKEDRIVQLTKENAVAYFTLLDQRSQRIQLYKMLEAQDGEVDRAQWAVIRSQKEILGLREARNKEIATQMVESRRKLQAQNEELKKAQEKNRLSNIVAPTEGRVNQLAIHTVGGIVTTAQTLMMIVPEDAQMEVEAWIANKDIGFVKVGQKAAIKVDAFSFQRFGLLEAEIKEISPDVVERPDSKEKSQAYRVILTLDKSFINIIDQQRSLSPGMTVNAEIKIREKRIIEFFLDSFRKYKNEALKER